MSYACSSYTRFMKNTLLLILALGISAACQSPQKESAAGTTEAAVQGEGKQYGANISTANSQPAQQVPLLLQDKDSLYLTLDGSALSSCTKKGCWMMVDLGGGEDMRVTFKDYGFFVPKDLQGERVVMEGVLKRAITSVEELRHYAEDAGKSNEEIQAIQQSDTTYAFEAVGVLIYPAK